MSNSNMYEIKIQDTNITLNSLDTMNVRSEGDYIVAKWQASKTFGHIKKLSAKEYMVMTTGEVKEYTEKDDRNTAYLKESMSVLRGLIRCNFDGGENQLMLTLTYRGLMRDSKKLYRDWDVFRKWLVREFGSFEYIAIAEPQKSGSWHFHILCKASEKLWFPQRKLLAKWHKVIGNGKDCGGVNLKRLRESTDIGAYYVAYFTDLIDESKKKEDEMNPEEMSKARQKGARLHFYPKHFKFFRCSRGIKTPELDSFPKFELDSEAGQPVFEGAREILKVYNDGTEQSINAIATVVYRKEGAFKSLQEKRAEMLELMAYNALIGESEPLHIDVPEEFRESEQYEQMEVSDNGQTPK